MTTQEFKALKPEYPYHVSVNMDEIGPIATLKKRGCHPYAIALFDKNMLSMRETEDLSRAIYYTFPDDKPE